MRIAFLSTLKGSPWGGSEELWVEACQRAIEQGHETLVSRYEWDVTPPKLAMLREAGATIVMRPRRPNRIARMFPRPKWLRAIEEFNPDALCLSQGGAYECAGHRSMRPLLKWLDRSDAALVNVIQFNSEDASLGTAAAVHARWLYNRATTNAFVARDNIRIAEARLGVVIPRSLVVVNPVNLADRSPLHWPEAPHAERGGTQTARFATVARLDSRTKGQDILLTVLETPKWKARAWTLDLYGEGPDEQRFRSMVRESGLENRVCFCGHVADIRALWSDHHALLLPSRAEGTPLAMLEAMLLGRPCMVCDVGGCADWVSDGVDGFLSLQPAQSHVASALERLWQARENWPEIGQRARERAIRQTGVNPGEALLKLLVDAANARVPAPVHLPSSSNA